MKEMDDGPGAEQDIMDKASSHVMSYTLITSMPYMTPFQPIIVLFVSLTTYSDLFSIKASRKRHEARVLFVMVPC